MSLAPYIVSSIVLAANIPAVIRGATRFVALVSATVDATNVEVSIGDSDSWQPLLLGLIPSEFPANVDRIAVRSATGQTVRVATGSAMVYDTRTAPGATTSLSLVDLGGHGLGQEVKASSLSVTLASDQGNLAVAGAGADGAAVTGNPMLIAGQDGTNAQSLKTNTTGQLEMVGAVASGSAIGSTAPVLNGLSDGTNVQRMKGSTTGAVFVAGEAAHSAASVGNPVRVGGRVVTAAETALVTGDAADIQITTQGSQTVKAFCTAELDVAYTPAAALTNTTNAVLFAAAGSNIRNYLTHISVKNTNATPCELIIVDGGTNGGTDGTVIGRFHLGASMINADDILLPNPRKSTANTAIHFRLSAAGAVYLNADGYKGF